MNKVVHLPLYGAVRCGKITRVQAEPAAKEVFNYYGIPFAKPPVDELRFMPPQK